MRKFLFLLSYLVSSLSFAQGIELTKNNVTPASSPSRTVPSVVNGVLFGKGYTGDAYALGVQIFRSYIELRSIESPQSLYFYRVDLPDRFEFWRVDASDISTPDNNSTVLVNGSGTRIKRFFSSVSIPQGSQFKGTWNASSNSPALTSTPADNGSYYLVSQAGTQSITGTPESYEPGDQIISNGVGWFRIRSSLVDGSVSEGKLAISAVTTTKIADAAITATKLASDVKARNLPFDASIVNVEPLLKAAVQEIKLYNVDPAKQYCIAVFSKAVNNNSQIRIYEWLNGAFGSLVFDWTRQNYVFPAGKQELKITNAAGQLAVLLIDWNQVPDGTNLSSRQFPVSGISPLTYRNQSDYDNYVAGKITANAPTAVNTLDSYTILRSADSVQVSNTNTRVNTNNTLSALVINLASQNKTFNSFAFPGHNFSNANAVYAFCLVRTASGGEETHLLPFDARTSDYKFLLNKNYSLTDGVVITFGYCNASYNTFAINAQAWSVDVVDANLSTTSIGYLGGGTNIFTGNRLTGGSTWKSTPYKLIQSTGILARLALAAPADASVTKAKLASEVSNALVSYPGRNVSDAAKVAFSSVTTALENTNVRDQNNSSITGLQVVFNAQNLSFNTFAFPGHNVSNANLKYAFSIVRTSAGYEETHLLPFDSRTGDYVFYLNNERNLSEGVTVTFGYCNASLQTVSPGTAIGLAANVADPNQTGTVIRYLVAGSGIYSASSPAGNAAWKSTPYKLLNASKLVYGTPGELSDGQVKTNNLEASIRTGLNPYPTRNSADAGKVVSSTLSTAQQNTQSRDQTNTTITGMQLVLATKNLSFNSFAFPGHNFTHQSVKYAFCYLKTASGYEETRLLPFDSRTSDYVFYLNNERNLSESVTISFGYCNASLNTVSIGTAIGLAANVADSTITGSVIKYIQPGGAITASTSNAGNPNWKSAPYKLLNASKVVYAPQEVSAAAPADPNPYSIILPNNLYLLSGNQFWYYDDAIVRNSHIYEKEPLRIILEARRSSDNAVITTPYSYVEGYGQIKADVNYSLTMRVMDYSKVDSLSAPLAKSTKVVNVTTKTRPTGITKKVLVIGDSYVDNKYGDGMLKYISDFALADGNTLEFIGTRTTKYGFLAEAYAGWSENTFTTRYVSTAQRIDVNGDSNSPFMHSRFMFSPDDTPANAVFSFSQYLTTYNVATPDIVMIFLGMNGGEGTRINQMITSIKAAAPSCKIVVNMVPGAEKKRYNFDSITRQLGRLTQNISYLAKFQGREAEGIFLNPCHMGFDRVYGLINTTQQRVQFNLDNVPAEVVNSDHHQTATGNKWLGYSNYNYLMYPFAL